LVCEPRGRHRYFRLADAEVAQALQGLALLAERGTHDRHWASPQRQRLRYARCCYGHLAGHLGVELLACLQREDRLCEAAGGYALTDAGQAWLTGLGFVVTPSASAGGVATRFAYGCLDWSERRDHLAGSLARQLLDHFVAKAWLRRGPKGDRALVPTMAGQRHLLPYLAAALKAQ
jgi:hypothetical protein